MEKKTIKIERISGVSSLVEEVDHLQYEHPMPNLMNLQAAHQWHDTSTDQRYLKGCAATIESVTWFDCIYIYTQRMLSSWRY